MSTRGLKALTGVLIGLGIVIMLGWPVLVGIPPKRQSSLQVKRGFVIRTVTAMSLLVVSVAGAGVGSVILLRRAREEYRQQAMANMRDLIEGAREDQLNRQPGERRTD